MFIFAAQAHRSVRQFFHISCHSQVSVCGHRLPKITIINPNDSFVITEHTSTQVVSFTSAFRYPPPPDIMWWPSFVRMGVLTPRSKRPWGYVAYPRPISSSSELSILERCFVHAGPSTMYYPKKQNMKENAAC